MLTLIFKQKLGYIKFFLFDFLEIGMVKVATGHNKEKKQKKVINKVPYTKLLGSTKGQKAKAPLKCKSMNNSSRREGKK